MTDTNASLKACPFCGEPLSIKSPNVNPLAVCDTEGCWMHDRAYTVVIDDPKQVAAWNSRTPPESSEPTGSETTAVYARMRDLVGAGDFGAALALMRADLSEMMSAFRTTKSSDGSYEMAFRFPSMEAMHRADIEWHRFRAALPTPPVQS